MITFKCIIAMFVIEEKVMKERPNWNVELSLNFDVASQ